jgi:mannose-1-phosphate guanylyltransferase
MLIPVILCGGAGTRLWPVSREAHPKPFMALSDGVSLLQKTLLRALSLPGVAHALTVSNRDLYFQTADHYRACQPDGVALSYLLEPCGRNTAPAIAAAALEVLALHGSQAQILVLAADHVISDQAKFTDAVARASELAAKGYLVTFGIAPDRPETGFGYIERDHTNPLGQEA